MKHSMEELQATVKAKNKSEDSKPKARSEDSKTKARSEDSKRYEPAQKKRKMDSNYHASSSNAASTSRHRNARPNTSQSSSQDNKNENLRILQFPRLCVCQMLGQTHLRSCKWITDEHRTWRERNDLKFILRTSA